MKKFKSLFLNTILLFWGGLVALTAFASCDNFLAGADVKKEIEETIAYNNAKDINVLIMPEIGTGTIVQNTNYTAKLGYPFEISFTEAAEYSFVEWIAVDKNNPEKKLDEGVSFDDAHSATTKVKISTSSVAVKIIPSCEKRIALAVEPSPRYDPLGVSRDRSITVTFTKTLNKSSFIYEENEIPAGAQIKKNEDEEIWAYTLNGQTYLKNISITNADDYSIADHFTCPLVNDKLLTIAVDKNEPIKFNSGEIFKTVKVTLSKDICDTKGIKMNTEKSWNYQITESTDDKASVNLTSDKGSVYLAGTKDYSIGQKITLALTEDADYQFVRWDYDSSIIYLAEPTNPNTTATVLEKTQGENTTQIKAICAPRLRVLDKGFSPLNDSENPTVSKNSSIVITFNQNLPDDEEGKKQLENISITIGGSPVNSSFKTPVINENTVTFVADNSNMLDVPAGQTKTVSVTVPADLYYKLADGTKVSYGANGISFNYKIDETTLDKAEITFSAATGSGTLKAANGTGNYSIGQEVSLVFEPADGWQFNGWSVTCGGEAVPETQIKIADKNALSTKLTVYEALAGLLVTAKTSECLSFTANPSAAVNPKDSEIKITFNKNLASDCASLLDKILINSGDLDDYYAERVLDGNTITIKNTSPLSVAKDTTKLITVTVPSDFYYMNDGIKVNLERKSFSFKVDHTTNAKTKVTYSVINGENDSAFNPSNAAGSIEGLQTNLVQYNIGEEVPLSFALADGYQFYGWKITDANGNLVTDTVSYKNNTSASSLQPTLVMNKAAEGLKISAVCYKRPSISTSTVTPYNANSAEEVAKNKAIVLNFAHKIMSETKDAIIVNYSAISNFNKNTYFSTSISEDEKTVTLKPIKMLPLNNSYETVTVTVPHDKVYYLASDGKTKITPSDEDFTWSYKINSSTEKQTEVRFATTDAAQIGRQINVGDTLLSSGSKQKLNIEQTVKLEYPIAEPDKYKFAGWKVSPATSGYTVTPSSYVTSGSITVKNESDTYFTLIVDSDDPTKASITSSAFMSNGTDGYGITVSAKDVELPSISTFSPSAAVNPKDSEIKIIFNKNLASDCASLLDKILINSGDLDDYYAERVLDGNTITIKNTSPLSVAKDTTKLITVTVPSDFYYMNDGIKVNLERKSFSFKVDHTTNAKTKVTYSVINGEGGAVLSAAGSIEDVQSNCQYNIGEEVSLSFAPASGYQFYGWKITDANGNLVTDTVSYKNNTSASSLQPTLVMNKAAEGLKISAVCYKRPTVDNLSPYSSDPDKKFEKNKPISLTFAHAIKEGTEQFIEIKYSVSSFSQSTYFSRSLSSDHTKVLFTPIKMLPVENAFETVTVTVPHDKVYYLAADGKTKITPADSDFTWSYKINNTTETKTNVRMDATDASGSIIKVNKNDFATGDKQIVNIEQSINIEYPVSAGYTFAGWKLTTSSNGYTITPADYTMSGDIIVSLGDKDYCKLTIDENNPNKAVFTSFDAISDGTDGYGVTVFAKDTALPVIQSVKIDDLTDIYNAQNTGISCDSKVYFNFNNPIDGETFTLARNGSITITDIDNPGLHFENYFTLYCYNLSKWEIIPKPELADEFFKNESDTLYLLITLNANRNEIKDRNGYKLIVNQTINNSFEIPYTVTGKRETKKPTWYGDTQKVAKTSASYDSGIKTNVFSNDWSASIRRYNHVAGSVWINMKGQDTESGVKALRVTETYYKDVQANDVNITQEPEDLLPTSVYSNYTYFNKEYKFKTHNDGILKLDFQLVDYAGNLSEPKTFYVIKDTSLDPSIIRMMDFKKETSYDGVSKCVTKRTDSNNQETITLTADNDSNTIKDIFYSIYNSTYNTTATWCDYQQDFTTEVWWGYSDDAITNKITQGGTATNKTYTFTHDTTRLTYVKIKCTDYVGNSQEIIRIIPPKPVIDSNCYTATANTASGANNGRFLKITPCNFASLQALKNKYNVNVLVYAELKNVTDNTASQIIKIPDNGWLLKAGKTYEIRPIYVFDFQDCWSSVACDKYFRISIENTVTSSSSCSASVLPNNTTFTIPAADKPDSIYLAITDSINSGCKKVTVTNSYSSNYSWVYMFKNRDTNKIELFTTKQFELPTPAVYYVILRAINDSGNTCDIQIGKVFANSTNTYRSYFNLTDDATPPVLNLPKEYTHEYYFAGTSTFSGLDWIEPSGYVIREMPTDAKSRIYEVEDSVGELSYYFIPSSGNRMTANERYTFDQLSEYTEHKLRYSFDKQTIVIPYLDLPEDCYKICVVVKDNNGNSAIQAGIAYNKIMAKSGVDYTIETDSTNTSNCQLVADFEDQNLFPNSNFEKTVHSYVCEINNKGDWILIKTSDGKHIDISNYTNGTHGSKSNSVSKALLNNKWIKIVTMQAGRNSPIIVNEAGFFDVKYVYTPKFLGTSAITCRKKNVAEGANGVSIFCDQPIFAHTMYYPKKLTEGKTAKDIAMWETKGIEISVKFDSSDFTYGSENYEDIPDGYYYTTVVHFADGTTVMSDVKQK